MGTAGHVVSIGLLLAAGLGIAISLVIRPPRDVPAAARRLAVGLALIFLLGPDVRFGYFIYPLGLIGWLALNARTGETQTSAAGARDARPGWRRRNSSTTASGCRAMDRSPGRRAGRSARGAVGRSSSAGSSRRAGPCERLIQGSTRKGECEACAWW